MGKNSISQEKDKLLAEDYKKLSERERKFVDEYLVRCRKNEAALAAGYAQDNPTHARQIGWTVYNRPHVKAYCNKALELKSMRAEEVVDLITDQANSDIRDYYREMDVVKTHTVKRHLSDIILGLEQKIAFQIELYYVRFYTRAQTRHRIEHLQQMQEEIEEHQCALRLDPNASIYVTLTETVKEMKLDIDLLVRDKSRGRIKKVKYGKEGELEVELYSAENAQDRLLRVAGKYEKDNRQKAPVQAPVIINWGDDETEIKQLPEGTDEPTSD